MTTVLPVLGGADRFAERLRRHEPMLGALIPANQFSTNVLRGLDFVVLSGFVPPGLIGTLRELGKPALVLVDSSAEVRSALDAGADGVVAAVATNDEASAVVAAARRDSPVVSYSSAPRLSPIDAAVVILGPALLASLDGVDAVLSRDGRACLVTSLDAARKAFASGSELVLYDLPAMFSSLLATLPDGRLAASGPVDREPFVLLSGMLGDATLWDGVAARLADVVVPWPARIDLDDSVPEMAASVLAEAPARFALGGHSLGAIVALEIMRQAPERVSRLMLVNASARAPVQAQEDTWAGWRQRTLDGEFDQIAAELSLVTLAAPRRADKAIVAGNALMARTVGADGFLRQLSAQSTRPDSRESVAAIAVPVLVVSGESDEICPPALQRELVERCARAELVLIQGGGHMLPLECADVLAEHVRAWLARH